MFPLAEERKIWMQGYVDRLSVTRDGVWQIHDYKTGRWVPTQEDLDSDRQLALYQIGVQRNFPREAGRVELVWHYLAPRPRTALPQRACCAREPRGRDARADRPIQADSTFETVTDGHCDRCSYRSICPAWAL